LMWGDVMVFRLLSHSKFNGELPIFPRFFTFPAPLCPFIEDHITGHMHSPCARIIDPVRL
jgi:hypothetical protein